jgi:two-component system, OmpR family, phosphate regulon response regulator PhoB
MSAILLIDDDEVVSSILERVLGSAGHSVDVVHKLGDGRDALDASDYDLVLLDINLPDGSGLDFLRSVRREGNRSTPIVVLSGMRQEDTIVQGFELGADDFVTKPFSPMELVARVDRWTRR